MESFSALADPTRRKIVEMIAASGQLSSSGIGAGFSISAPAISQHLKVLKEAGLVRVEKRAQQRLYSINPDGMTEMEQWIQQMKQTWHDSFDALDALLKSQDH